MMLQKVTNIFWRHWSGRDRAKDWVDYLAETEATSLKCTAGGIQAQASSKFYFGSGWQTCLWNKQLLELLVKHTLEKRAADPNKYNVPDVSHGYLMALYYGSLKEAHAEWSRQQPRGGETTHDARVRAAEYNTKRRERNIGNSRKQAVSGRPACSDSDANNSTEIQAAHFDSVEDDPNFRSERRRQRCGCLDMAAR